MTTLQHGEAGGEPALPLPREPADDDDGGHGGTSAATRARQFLTFRLDREFRQRLRTRLAGEGRSLSEVVIHGLHLYLQQGGPVVDGTVVDGTVVDGTVVDGTVVVDGPALTAVASVADLVLPDKVTVYLRDLRASGQSELLSATLAALHDAGWPLRPLAAALGVSRQAVLARVRQHVPAEVRSRVQAVAAPAPFPRRRSAQPEGRRPHLTVKIDQALRAAAHREAQREGSSLSEVIERILDHYLHHGLPHGQTHHGEIYLGDTTPTRPTRRKRQSPAPPDPAREPAHGKQAR